MSNGHCFPQLEDIIVCSDTFSFSAHEVGQVKCGSCAVLLMYQFGAASVRCSSCSFVTEIGVSDYCDWDSFIIITTMSFWVIGITSILFSFFMKR